MMSMTMVISTPYSVAKRWKISIWVAFPSTNTTQVFLRSGSRMDASSKACRITGSASYSMLAQTLFM